MTWLFAAALLVQLAYWSALAVGLGRARGSSESGEGAHVPISVIVAARNEEQRIDALLDALLAQTHEHFEVVVVDDSSSDDTAGVVKRLGERDERFRVITISQPTSPRKKHALTAGVRATRHDRLAFTDADCVPGPRWLDTIAAHAAAEPSSVLVGYGPLRREPGGLNAFVRYETLITALMAAAATGLGRAYMAVGRNFSYPRRLFDELGGYESHLASLSGDDDLLVQQARRAGAHVRYMLEEPSFVYSDAPPTWRAWIRQKLRHTSAGRFYDRSAQVHLSLFHASNLGVWIAPLFLGWTGAALLAARFLGQRIALRRASEAFHAESDLMIYQPLLDFGYLLYNTLLAPAGVFVGGRKW